MAAVPVYTPLHAILLLAATVPVNGINGAKLVVDVNRHPVPLSRTFTVYVPGYNPTAILLF